MRSSLDKPKPKLIKGWQYHVRKEQQRRFHTTQVKHQNLSREKKEKGDEDRAIPSPSFVTPQISSTNTKSSFIVVESFVLFSRKTPPNIMNPNNNNGNNTGPNKPSDGNGNISARAMIEFRRFRSCSPYEGILSSQERHASIDDMLDAALSLVGRRDWKGTSAGIICYPDRRSNDTTGTTTTTTTTTTNNTPHDKNQQNGCLCFMAEPRQQPQPSSHPPQPSATTARGQQATAAAPPTSESTASISNLIIPENTQVESISTTRRLTQQKNPNNENNEDDWTHFGTKCPVFFFFHKTFDALFIREFICFSPRFFFASIMSWTKQKIGEQSLHYIHCLI